MDLLATPTRRKVLFACLYFSEGAPIGFIWLAFPTRLRLAGVPLETITGLAAVLVLPWAFKFVWAPLVDVLQSRRWSLRHWIMSAQAVMGASLVPLVWLDAKADFRLIAGLLIVHALAAATQDVAIDALCIRVTPPHLRGRLNGWMQAGMLLGRASMGGGALVLGGYIGDAAVVVLLIGLTTFSLMLVATSRPPDEPRIENQPMRQRGLATLAAAHAALVQRNTWLGLMLALIGPAAFKSLEVIYGPFLVDQGYSQESIGSFSAGPMIFSMIAGALVGGWLADRYPRRRLVAAALLYIALTIYLLAVRDWYRGPLPGVELFPLLAAVAVGIGLFTSSLYALLMDMTTPGIAATQFSAFMGASNGCESWSTFAAGRISKAHGYPLGMLAMCGASLLALPLLWAIRRRTDGNQTESPAA